MTYSVLITAAGLRSSCFGTALKLNFVATAAGTRGSFSARASVGQLGSGACYSSFPAAETSAIELKIKLLKANFAMLSTPQKLEERISE